MKITRRNFLAWAGLGAVGAVACEGFGIRHGELDIQSPARLPEDLVRGKDNWYASLCRTCPSCEGIMIRVMEGRAKKIQGNPLYPTNQGKQSVRCDGGLQALYHPDRITGPMVRSGAKGSGFFTPISWQPRAMDHLKQELQAKGGSSLMVTQPLRGHLATVVDRFTQAIGGQHLALEAIDNNTYRAAIRRVFQQDLLPDFDIQNANFILSFGADFLSTWVSPTRWNLGYGEFRQGSGKDRGTLYQVDSRFSMTAANADRWVPITPGWEGHLAMSVAQVILSENLAAPGVDTGALAGAGALDAFSPESVAGRIGLTPEIAGGDPAEYIRSIAREFAANRPSIAIGGGSAGAHSNGLFNLEAIYALNYLVGSVGTTGGIRFNPGSPLPDAPAAGGSASLGDWSDAVDRIRDGRISMLMLHNADPVHGLPGALDLRNTLMNREDLFIVSFSPFLDETSVMADLILPDRVFLEDWGDDIPEPGPGHQVLGFQQPVVNPLQEYNPQSFPDILLTMGQELGKESQLPWNNFRQLLREGSDALFAMNRGSIEASSPDEFWTSLMRNGGWWDEDARGPERISPPNGLLARIARDASTPDFPGLGMTRGTIYLVPFAHNSLLDGSNGHLPWIQAAPDPLTTITWQTWVEMNDTTADDLDVREGDVVEIESTRGSVRALVYPTPAIPPGVIAMPFGQGRRSGSDWASDRPARESANVMDLLEPTRVRGTGSLAWAATRVRLTKTGESVKLSKLEGDTRAVEIGVTQGEEIIKTVAPEIR